MKVVKKNPIWLVALGLLMAAQLPAFASQDKDSEKVKEVVNAFHHALKASNAKEARSLLNDNVLIFEGGSVERSAEEYAHHHMLADMKYLAALDSEVIEHNVMVSGEYAYSVSRTRTKGEYKGKQRDYVGMETIVLRRTPAGWEIVHIHWSR
jgi:ketosteroid isomerase-like protein